MQELELAEEFQSRLEVRFLNIQTAKSNEFKTASTNFTVAAVQRRIGARSNIGIIMVNKDELNNKSSATRFNRVFGLIII